MEESGKAARTILHIRTLPKKRSPFTTPCHRPKWPNDLWTTGTLIYSVNEPSLCLPAKRSKSDKVLRFDSRFESGNLMYAYHLGENTYHLVLEYDRNRSGTCQWFYFEITNMQKDVNYQFYISGFHKRGGVFCSGSKVFMYSNMNARLNKVGWTRAGNAYGYGVTMTDATRKRSSLQFQMKFPFDNDTVYFSYAIPYTYSDLLRDVRIWERSPDVQVDTVCQTVGGRDCPILTITSPAEGEVTKPCVFITSRVHPGESNSSLVVKGVIEFLISNNPIARYLLDNYVVKVVPMMCIDGVVEGHYRCSLTGHDLNRVWDYPSPASHPVVYHVKEMMKAIAEHQKIEAYIDLHGHSYLHGTFAYGCPNEGDESLAGVERVYPRILSLVSNAFSWDRCIFSYPDGLKSASRLVVKKELGVIHSFTIESSFGGVTWGPMSGVLYDARIWTELGGKIGEGLYHLLNPVATPVRISVNREFAAPEPKEVRPPAPTTNTLIGKTQTRTIVIPAKRGPSLYGKRV